MGLFGNSVKTPDVVKAPTIADPNIAADAEAERKRRANAAGQTNNLSSSLSSAVSDSADATSRSSLLG